jgi:plastocyanin
MKNILILATLFACSDKEDTGSENIDGQDCGTIHTVTTTDDSSDMDVYMDFDPEDLTIAVGDCVNFVMSETHNAVEVSQESYDDRDGTALDGGFQVQFGETMEIYFGEAGTHYYVCQPHIAMDMIGTITVQ